MKKNIIFLLILFFGLNILFPFTVDALFSPKALEVEYPGLIQAPKPTSTSTLPNYVKYIYVFAIVASGFVALVVLVIAGFQYTVSIGMPEKIRDAKDKIWAALLGLLILLSSYLILNTINPQLTFLPEPGEVPSIIPDIEEGVYLCKQSVEIKRFWRERKTALSQKGAMQDQSAETLGRIYKTIKENCLLVESEGNLPSDFEDKIRTVYLVPNPGEDQYGVVLYDERINKGKAQGKGKVLYGKGWQGGNPLNEPSEWGVQGLSVSSASPFVLIHDPPSSWYANLYELVHYNRDDVEGEKQPVKCQPNNGAIGECPSVPKNKDGESEIGSVEIEGDMFVIFFKESGGGWNMSTEITVIPNPGNTNLNNTLMGEWKRDQCQEEIKGGEEIRYYPCAEKATVVSANFY